MENRGEKKSLVNNELLWFANEVKGSIYYALIGKVIMIQRLEFKLLGFNLSVQIDFFFNYLEKK